MKKGQILVEMLLAFAIMALVLVAMTGIATKSLSNSNFSRSKSQANAYATEGVEWIKGQEKTNGIDFLVGKSGTYCINTLDWNTTGSCVNQITGTGFSREVNISGTLPQITLVVTVKWTESNKVNTSVQTTVFTKF